MILTVPHPVLRQVALPADKLDQKIWPTIRDMTRTLLAAKNPEGVGLAAPQIGVSLRIFLIRPLPDKTITAFINPEITKFSRRQQTPNQKNGAYEGCLSLPGHYAPITRSMSVTVKFATLENFEIENYLKIENLKLKIVQKTNTFSGFPAHIIQHEMDHLNGLLFIDRVLEQNCPLYRAAGKSWHEIKL